MLLGLVLGCVPRVLHPDVNGPPPTTAVAQLRRIDVIHPVGEHYYWVVHDPEEGWHRVDLFSIGGGKSAIVVDHFHPDAPFHKKMGRPARIAKEFRGARAERVIEVLKTAKRDYTRDRYYLLGPNSNTFAAWVARRARVGHDFTTRAVGRTFLAGFGISDSRTGLRLHTPVIGFDIGLREGVELHLGPSTWGVDLLPPALKTPFGRLGFPQPALPLDRSDPPPDSPR